MQYQNDIVWDLNPQNVIPCQFLGRKVVQDLKVWGFEIGIYCISQRLKGLQGPRYRMSFRVIYFHGLE